MKNVHLWFLYKYSVLFYSQRGNKLSNAEFTLNLQVHWRSPCHVTRDDLHYAPCSSQLRFTSYYPASRRPRSEQTLQGTSGALLSNEKPIPMCEGVISKEILSENSISGILGNSHFLLPKWHRNVTTAGGDRVAAQRFCHVYTGKKRIVTTTPTTLLKNGMFWICARLICVGNPIVTQ